MRIFLLVIIFIFPRLTWAQLDMDSINSEFAIFIEPLSILPTYSGSSLRVGTEYKLKKKWSMYNELGYYVNYINEANYPKRVKGYTTKIELKHYRINVNQASGRYISLEFFLKNQNYIATDTIHNGLIRYGKEYSVSKNVEALSIKYGKLKVYKFGLVIDSYIGVGVRFKQTENSLTEEENKY